MYKFKCMRIVKRARQQYYVILHQYASSHAAKVWRQLCACEESNIARAPASTRTFAFVRGQDVCTIAKLTYFWVWKLLSLFHPVFRSWLWNRDYWLIVGTYYYNIYYAWQGVLSYTMLCNASATSWMFSHHMRDFLSV